MRVLSIICLLCNKNISVLVVQILSLGLVIVDYANDSNNFDSLIQYQIGFYVLLVALIISIVLAFIRLILNKKFS